MKKTNYPSWESLTLQQQLAVSNGCGTDWMPKWFKTFVFGWFFEASCRRHDFGYLVGGNELRRWSCDYQFAVAMYADTKRVKRFAYRCFCIIAMAVFYLAVALFGWIVFRYGTPLTYIEIEQILTTRANEANHEAT